MRPRPRPFAHLSGRLRARAATGTAGISPTAPERSRWAWLANVAAVLAVLSLVVSLFGYGVLMGLGAIFLIDHNLLISSPLDLILSAWIGVMDMLPKALSGDTVLDVYRQSQVFAVFLLIVVMLVICRIWFVGPDTTFAEALKRVVSPKIRRARTEPRGEERLMSKFLMVGTATVILLGPLLAWLALGLTLSVVAIVPLTGYSAAQSYAKRYILPAAQCLTPANAETEGVRTLHCVSIQPTDKGAEPKTGHIVIATSAYALLYDPATRLAERVPTQNVVIRSLSPAAKVP